MKFINVFVFSVITTGFLTGIFHYGQAANIIEEKQAELRRLELEINEKQEEIEEKSAKDFDFAEHLKILETKLDKNKTEQTKVKKNIELAELEINATEDEIAATEKNLHHQQELLGGYLRELNRYDQANKILLVLNSGNISDFYNQVNYTENISAKSLDLTEDIAKQKDDLMIEREFLVNYRLEHQSLLANMKLYEDEVARAQEELTIMRQQNAEEVKSLADTVAYTTEIKENLKQEIFALTREGQSLQFQEAVREAKFASANTGVRPELIMSIVKQETNFGNNVGNGNYKTDMKPDQWETFAEICKSLGRSPETTPVSARPKSYSGWGGAMGIAQFLPTTWLTVKDETAQITGNNPADPWNARDAFVAVGVKLKKMGAADGNRDKEWEAAGRYFAGGNYKKFPWYGDNVMDRADKYKDMMEKIED